MAHRILFTCSRLQAELNLQGDGAAVGEGEVTEERQSAPRLARTCHLHVVLRQKKKFLKAHNAWSRRIQMSSFKAFRFVVVAVFVVSSENIWCLNSTREKR